MKNNKVLNSPRLASLKEKRQQNRRKRFFFWLFLFVVFLVLLSIVARWDKLNIQNIEISGNKIIDTSSIEKTINENLQGNYLFIFPKTNFLLYPQKQIKSDLVNSFSRIKEVYINDKSINTLVVEIKEHEGKYLWCGETTPESNEEKRDCYFLNQDGYVFDEAPYFSGEVYLKFYGKLEGEKEVGSFFMEKRFLDLIKFRDLLESVNIKPIYFYKDIEGDIRVGLSSLGVATTKPEIIFKSSEDYQKIGTNIETVFKTDPLKTVLAEKYESILYIDFRFGNKVYYKLR